MATYEHELERRLDEHDRRRARRYGPQLPPGPLGQIAAGVVLGLLGFGLLMLAFGGCGQRLAAPALPRGVLCQLGALDALPDDPNMATVYDAVDVIERLRACSRIPADGGAS